MLKNTPCFNTQYIPMLATSCVLQICLKFCWNLGYALRNKDVCSLMVIFTNTTFFYHSTGSLIKHVNIWYWFLWQNWWEADHAVNKLLYSAGSCSFIRSLNTLMSLMSWIIQLFLDNIGPNLKVQEKIGIENEKKDKQFLIIMNYRRSK